MNFRYVGIPAAILTMSASLPALAAASLYVDIPSIPGEASILNHPAAINVSSLTVTPGGFSITKQTDIASPKLFSAVVNGTSLSTVHALVFKGSPTSKPTGDFAFSNVLASSQTLGPPETDRFNSSSSPAMFVVFDSFTNSPTVPLNAFTLTANELTIDKPIDALSPILFADVAAGKVIPKLTLLYYQNGSSSGGPDVTLEFDNSVAAKYATGGSTDVPTEQVSFDFSSLQNPIPEPATAATLLLAIPALTLLGRRQKA